MGQGQSKLSRGTWIELWPKPAAGERQKQDDAAGDAMHSHRAV
jgi:hypothetical protein